METPMTRRSHRITAAHVGFLAAAPTKADGRRLTVLALTDDGIRLVDPGVVLAPDSGVRRRLLSLGDLLDGAEAIGVSLSTYVRAEAGRIASELNALLVEPSA
jgi:hypothetical protein